MHVYKISSCLQHCKSYKNPSRLSKVMITNVLPPFLLLQCTCLCPAMWCCNLTSHVKQTFHCVTSVS